MRFVGVACLSRYVYLSNCESDISDIPPIVGWTGENNWDYFIYVHTEELSYYAA